MNIHTARELINQTLNKLRWSNNPGVTLLWQMDYQYPLVPHLLNSDNQRIEKLVERLAFLPKDFPDTNTAQAKLFEILRELEVLGITIAPNHKKEHIKLNQPDSIWIDFI